MRSTRPCVALGLGFEVVRMLATAGCCMVFADRVQAGEEMPADIIADQIRKQGYSCNKALSAERDRERSKPDEAVWVLKCDAATYRVRLVPDMAAKVERID